MVRLLLRGRLRAPMPSVLLSLQSCREISILRSRILLERVRRARSGGGASMRVSCIGTGRWRRIRRLPLRGVRGRVDVEPAMVLDTGC